MTEVAARLNAALEGRYSIERQLGEGGMATVYLARDEKHNRNVALKVLKPELAAVVGADRFLAEIKTTANLQHPHILPLFDSGEADGFLFYVMPYVEGETLREKLDREGELPVHETVRILRDIVDALAHAHAGGIVHRDVKPGNVMISGRHALVMDFGVARAFNQSAAPDERTTAGMAVGTPAYMSPEQAAADPNVDHRADIYSAGVVAYELLAGVPPFEGRTPREILTAHVTRTPRPLNELRESVPPALGSTIMRCLAKRPADRWQKATELLEVLDQALTPSLGMTPVATPPVRRVGRGHQIVAGVAAAALLAVAARVILREGGDAPPLVITESQRLTRDDGMEIHPAVSPDGRFVVFAAGTPLRMRLYLRPVAGGRTIPLTDDSTALEHHPRYSPDGERILFISNWSAMTVSALGGATTIVATDGVANAAWSPDGSQILLMRSGGLTVLPAGGGEERMVAEGLLADCDWSPVADVVACVRENAGYNLPGEGFGNLAPSAIVSVDLTDGTVSELVPLGALNQSPVWSVDGRTLFFVSNRQGQPDIFAQRVNADLRPDGEAERVTTGLSAHTISLSADGSRLGYSVFVPEANAWRLAIPDSPPGDVGDAEQLTFGQQVVEAMQPSADGRWLYYDSDVAGNSDVWRIRLDGGPPEQLTDDPRQEFAPSPSPDGSQVAFHGYVGSSRELFVLSLSRGTVEQITDNEAAQESYPQWSPDGTSLLYLDQASPAGLVLLALRPDGGWGEPELIEAGSKWGAWSSHGDAVAYSTPGGEIVRFDLASRERTVLHRSDLAIGEVVWSRDDRFLYAKRREADGALSIIGVPSAGGDAFVALRMDDPRLTSRFELRTDGEFFYFRRENQQSDIWLASTSGR